MTPKSANEALATSADVSMAPVRALFASRFESEILAFESLRQEIGQSQSAAALRELALRIHKIAGVAGTLGYTEIGASAMRLEKSITELAEREPSEVLARIDSRLDTFLDLLEAELD